MASLQGKAAQSLIKRHPLQWLDSPSRGWSGAVHSMLSFVCLTAELLTWKPLSLVDNPNDINNSYGWHFQYLTIIGLALATSTFIVGFLADVFASRALFKVKNGLSVASAPLEVLISILYWSLATIDKSLVLPDWVEETSKQVDFGFHLLPAVFLAVDLLFFSPPWTIGAVPAMGLSACLSVSYWVWVEACYANNGWYPYPIFEVEPLYRSMLFLGSALTMAANTALLQWIYRQVNGDEARMPKARPGNVKGQ